MADKYAAAAAGVLWSLPGEINMVYGNLRYPDLDDMIRPIKHDKASKHKKSRMFKMNISVHPFVLIAIMAALTVVVLVIVVYFFKYLK